MISLAFTFSTTGLYVCALHGNKDSISILYKNKIALPKGYTVNELTQWFETELDLLLNKINPDYVNYRLTINNVTNDFVSKVYYGQGILNLLCFKKSIVINHKSPTAIVASRFGLTKGTDLHEFISALLSNPTTPWDSKMRDTALMALISFY
ncbi:hypothetical protein LJ707_16210 [Mucilaginibacter sp. UR6-1]|uniref:hypothetical protein n=1 Tax=Mucilaginibacter sp. UR6-1 TaxID=1435643 RepID=UPI001E5BB678|nr:hypothetical protein [Mucilaginibacter sp. UR6-1]MCC8410487.1 hypothetical protein [Mucilaginibacter sp. UR6-1]